MAMSEHQTGSDRIGLSDEQLAGLRTVFAADILAGRTVMLSGASGGIGRAIAWLFARLGAHVVAVGRDRSKLDALVAGLEANGLRASAHAVDIRDAVAVGALFDKVGQDHGVIDALVNCAGGQYPQAAIDFSAKGWHAVIDTNLNGTWHMMQAAARRWRDAGRPGSIANIVIVTTHGLYGVAHSIAARSGVIGLTRSVAVEWAPLGIRVNCVAPGAIETEGWKVYTPEVRTSYARANPMMRTGSAWDIAEAVAYLTVPSGNFVTGETLTVDGGAQLWGESWAIEKPEYFRTAESSDTSGKRIGG